MTDQEDNINRGEFVFDEQSEEEIVVLFDKNLFEILVVFLSQFFVISLINFGCF